MYTRQEVREETYPLPVNQPEALPPDYFCPNPRLDCPGKGADLEEITEPVLDTDGKPLGAVVFMACRICGYRWDREG